MLGDNSLNFRARHAVLEARPELDGMTLVMEQNESPDPWHIGLLGSDATVPYSYQLTHLVQQPRQFPVLRISRHKNLLRRAIYALGRETIEINAVTSSVGYRAERRSRRYEPAVRPRVTYLGFFPLMLLLGGSGFLMAYTGAVSLVYLYVYNSCTILGFVVAYLCVFGRDEVKWMFINAALGAFGICIQLDWVLFLFAKKLSDYPIYVHVVPFVYYVLFTFLFRQLLIDLTGSREDEGRRTMVERWYVAASVLVYLLIGAISWRN